jgi:hypothetical protein
MKILILSTIICLFTTISSFSQAYSGGNGSQQTPYLISSKADMVALAEAVKARNNYSGKYFLLTRDLTGANDVITTIIGIPITGSTNRFFSGTFDGGGHIIEVNINASERYMGIFGYVENATIKNLGITGSISSTYAGNPYTGGICGYAVSTTLSDCYNTGRISSRCYIGGICGFVENSTSISNCYNTGEISADYSSPLYVGGICGICGYSSTTSIINNCYNTGKIAATSSLNSPSAGGICGYSSSTINNCYNTGEISAVSTGQFSGNTYAGGICGYLSNKTSNCFAVNTSIVGTTTEYTGRIVGRNNEGIIEKCHASASMTINSSTISSQNAASENGKDAQFSDFQSQPWIETNVSWDFNAVWAMSDINSVYQGLPIFKSQSSTGIPELSVEKESLYNIRYYDLQGRSLSNPPVGKVFIESGENIHGKVISHKKLITQY